MTRICVILVIALLPSSSWGTDAFEVTALAPADSIGVIAWTGANNVQGFEDSRLGQLWAEPSVRRFLTRPASTGWPVLQEKLAERVGQERADLLLETLAELWRRPGIFCLFPVEPRESWRHPVAAAVIWDMGPNAAARAETALRWFSEEAEDELPVLRIEGIAFTELAKGSLFFAHHENHWLLVAGEQGAEAVTRQFSLPDGFNANPLNQRARNAIGPVHPFYYACFDMDGLRDAAVLTLVELYRESGRDGARPGSLEIPLAFTSAAVLLGGGTSGSQEFATAIAFDGPHLHQKSYARADQADPGPFDFISNLPLDLDWLRSVPGDAVQASLSTWQPQKVYTAAIGFIEQIWNEVVEQTPGDSGPAPPGDLRQRVRAALDFDPEDVLAHLGPHLLFYQRSAIGMPVFVLVLEVRDAEGLQAGLDRLLDRLPDGVEFRRRRVAGETLHVLNLPDVPAMLGNLLGSPCWALTRDRLIISSRQAAAAQWLRDRAAPEPAAEPLSENAALRAFLAEHEGPALSWLRYVDEVESFMPQYAQLGMLYGLAARWVTEQEPRIRFAALPPASDIERHLRETVSWGTVEGNVRMEHDRTGLPLVTSSAYVAKTAMGVSILLPSLARARELARRTVCAANLKGIGVALHTHAAADDQDRFPPDLKTLVDAEMVSPKTFICPSSTAEEGDLDACYVYIPGQKTTDDPSNVLIYEKPECHSNEGANVLFLDGSVEFITPPERLEEILQESRERMESP